MEGLLSPNSKTKSSTSAQISNHAQELAKQALNHIIQQKGLDKEKIWEFVSKLKRFLNNLIQMASRKGSTVKQAVESNVYKLMVSLSLYYVCMYAIALQVGEWEEFSC